MISFLNIGILFRKRRLFFLQITLLALITIVFLAALHANPTHIQFNDSSKFRTISEKNFNNHETENIRRKIEQHNKLQPIWNQKVYGSLENDSVVIVVQVHNRITYLKALIDSLSNATNISKTLVIFSHDYYDADINDLVRSIDFCKVLQIFYPHSIQTHANEFPGSDPDDCPRNLKRNEAINRKCINAHHPDSYGHYREAKYTQTKHHWWWKANQVFDQLDVTQDFNGPVLFLEEDHYLTADFVNFISLMQKQYHGMCSKCNILSLGTYMKQINDYVKAKDNEVLAIPWISTAHNMGFALNRTTWNEIKNCSKVFCTFDDYNWDWTLLHLSEHCLTNKLHVLVPEQPRVFHLGECGLHHQKQNCDPNEAISKLKSVFETAKKTHQLESLVVKPDSGKNPPTFKQNGGWSDIRDHALCMNFTHVI